MHLKHLEIELYGYGPDKGKYIAKVRVGDDKSEIRMELSPEVSAVVLSNCITFLCEATDRASSEMKQKLMDCLPLSLPNSR